jgi:hypothetical protein
MNDLELAFVTKMFGDLAPHLSKLPKRARRSVLLAQSVLAKGPTADELSEQLGGRNWVIARRTPRIVDRYGDDVICVTPHQFTETKVRVIESRVP